MSMPKHWSIYKNINIGGYYVDFVIFNHKENDMRIKHQTIQINHIQYKPEECNLFNLIKITHEEFMLELL
jgi:hypothetical protein